MVSGRWVVVALLGAGCSTSFPAPDNYAHGSEGDAAAEPPGCGDNPEAMADCVEQARYLADLEFVAMPRPPGDAHWQAVQDLCFDRFTELGYAVELQQYGTGINVIGRREGLTRPEEMVVVAAHYDHLPDCDGADDNATGVAGVLEAARVLAEGQFERTVVVACWDQEEIGKIGSRAWVQRTDDEGGGIVANFNFEMIGYTDSTPGSQTIPFGFDSLFPEAVEIVEAAEYRADFITVIADDRANEMATSMVRYGERLGLPLVHLELASDIKNSPLLGDLRRSDHAPFWELNYPAMMITDTANFRYGGYHCVDGQDTVDRLDHEFSTKVVRATVAATAETLGLVVAPPD